MLKKIVVVLLLISFTAKAQTDTIRVKIAPGGRYEKLMMYSVVGAKQEYVGSAKIENNEFKLLLFREDDHPGIYRVYYDTKSKAFFDFIYNNESVSVTYKTVDDKTATYHTSKENILYQDYLDHIQRQEYKVDSIQYAYFNPNIRNEAVNKSYQLELEKLHKMQENYELKAKGTLAYHFINSHQKYKFSSALEKPDRYLEILKSHFFEYVDFDDEVLYNSSFLIDQVVLYVFNICRSDDPKTDRELKKAAIDFVMTKVASHDQIKSDILTSLIYALAGEQEIRLTNYLINNYYNDLPDEFHDKNFVAEITKILKTAIGAKAPNFNLFENKVQKKLWDLEGAGHYLVVFWSTSCSHCMLEIPSLYEVIKDLKTIKVVAIALEKDTTGFATETPKMPNWIHVLGNGKWKNGIAVDYDIQSTPSYFILDADKKIVAKPQNLAQVEAFLNAYH